MSAGKRWPFVEYERKMLLRLLDQRDALLALPEGWHEGGEKKVDPDTLANAITAALRLSEQFGYKTPTLVPCSDGSVQIEIHEGGWDVECHISRLYRLVDTEPKT